MKSKSIAKFLIVVLLVAAVSVCAFGVQIGSYQIAGVMDEETGIRKGMDLAGGSSIVFEPVDDQGKPVSDISDDDLNTIETILRTRLDQQGLNEATTQKQGDNRVRVEMPSVLDPQDAIKYLGDTAKLTFRDYQGELIMEGDVAVKDASAEYSQISEMGGNEHHVKLELTSEGQAAFAAATDRISKLPEGQNIISIYLDYKSLEETKPVSSPRVSEMIDSSSCVISGNFDADSAKMLAGQIKSGQLPYKLNVIESRTVGATLGDEALNKSLQAALVALILVMIFMLVFYRMCGLMANVALVAYVTIVAWVLAIARVNLTLPGIAGIILTIGTAVDANVIIFERIKDELRIGKTLRASVDSGFNKALTAIIDANVTTLIAAAVLYFLGTGSIKGFAITLFIGTVVSMFTAIFVTKFLLRQLVGFGIKNPKLYCAMKKGGQQ